MRRTKSQNLNVFSSRLAVVFAQPIENADRRFSNDIWVINTFIAYQGAAYIRGLTVYS